MTLPQLRLPRTDLTVSALCLGGNRLGGELDQVQSFELLDTFVEAGGTFIDTAHLYADWLPHVERSCSEKTIGRWLRARGPAGIVVATKGGQPEGDPPVKRLDRASLRRDVTASLSHLGLSALDLFYVHRDDPARPAAEILATLEELRRDGLVRHYAASNWSLARLREADTAARAGGYAGFAAHQAEWSLAVRNPGTAAADLVTMDARHVQWHARTGMTAIPYSSQAKGYFDKTAQGRTDEYSARYDNAPSRAMAARLGALAAEMNASPTQVMLKALTLAPFATIPVIGCRTPEQVRSSAASLAVPLSAARAASLLNLNL